MKKALYLSLPFMLLASCASGDSAPISKENLKKAIDNTISLNYGNKHFDVDITAKIEGEEKHHYAYYDCINNFTFAYENGENTIFTSYGRSDDGKAFYKTYEDNIGRAMKSYIKEEDAPEDYLNLQRYFTSYLPMIKKNLENLTKNSDTYFGEIKEGAFDLSFRFTTDELDGMEFVDYASIEDKKTGDCVDFVIFTIDEQFSLPPEGIVSSLTKEAFEYISDRVYKMDNFSIDTSIDDVFVESLTRIDNRYYITDGIDSIDFKFEEEEEETKWYILDSDSGEWKESSLSTVGMYLENYSLFSNTFESFGSILDEFTFFENDAIFQKDDGKSYFYIKNDYVEQLKTVIEGSEYRFEVSNIGLLGGFVE